MFDDLAAAAGERALFRTRSAWGVDAVIEDARDLVKPGFYAIVMTFEGSLTALRMQHVIRHESFEGAHALRKSQGSGRANREWMSSLDALQYQQAVERTRQYIGAGDVYQANITRVMTQAGSWTSADMDDLFCRILAKNPAPFASRIDAKCVGVDVTSASPELYLARQGSRIESEPIKGTAATPEQMLAKDRTENIMITDLVRNDLQRVCEPGTVVVERLLESQNHPGLTHLASRISGQLTAQAEWADIFDATFPPGSVSGAPKSSALRIIGELEQGLRGPYCGAIGWIDTQTDEAELAVGIRTFWRTESGDEGNHGALSSASIHFGTGAGITWESQPVAEWDETELKAHRLLGLVPTNQRSWE